MGAISSNWARGWYKQTLCVRENPMALWIGVPRGRTESGKSLGGYHNSPDEGVCWDL